MTLFNHFIGAREHGRSRVVGPTASQVSWGISQPQRRACPPQHGSHGCDASMSNCDVPGSDRDASVSGCDVTSSGDASMPNRDVPGSDGDTSMSDCDMTGHRDTFT